MLHPFAKELASFATTASALAALAIAAPACKKPSDAPAKATQQPQQLPQQPTPAPEPAAPAFKEITGFSTPESVLVLPDGAGYLVSNINGSPADADDNGFISKVSPEGAIETLQWIDGATDKITLNAPKGMAIRGGKLYVADITAVRAFDLATGAAAGDIAIKGASFLNDLASDGDNLYVSDTGVDAAFKPTGNHAVYRIGADDKPVKILEGAGTEAPNGLAVASGADGKPQVWVNTFAAPEVYRIADGKKADVQSTPKGGLDGLAVLADGRIIASSWEGNALYAGKPGEAFTAIIEDVESPADFAIDQAKGKIFIPLFQRNAVRIYDLK